jgi:hypothetical protein
MRMLISYLYCNQGGVTSVIKQRMPVLLENNWIVDTVFMYDNGGQPDLLKKGVKNVEIFKSDFKYHVEDESV